MESEKPSVYYLVGTTSDNKFVGFGSFFYEFKITRDACTAGHLGEIYVDEQVLSPEQIKQFKLKLVEELSSKISQIRPETYKINYHLNDELQIADYSQLKYIPQERHMSLYNYNEGDSFTQIDDFENKSTFHIKKLQLEHKAEVERLLNLIGKNFDENVFLKILQNMNLPKPSVYYMVAFNQNEQFVGFGSFFYETKNTRGECTSVHIQEMFTHPSLQREEVIQLQKSILGLLTKKAFELRNISYKASYHAPEEYFNQFLDLGYIQEERHMTCYKYPE